MEIDQIIERCSRGDGLAWEALVRRYQARVYGLAVSYVRNPEEARDVAQEIFVRVFRKIGSFRPGVPAGSPGSPREREEFLPWLLRLGRNVCIDHLRRLKARPAGSAVPLEEAPDLADTARGPHDAAEATASRALVYRALEVLGDQHREMIVLKEIQGLKIEEVASILGIPTGTVKSRSNRARIELAKAILRLEPAAGSPGLQEA
jgi:RNA polymerase sigma-70 factor (ECF subfamily)